MKVVVWICPTPRCGNYYASSSIGDLRETFNRDAKGKRTHSRARCPDCSEHRQRIPHGIVIPNA